MIIRTEDFQKFTKVLLSNLYVNALMPGSDLLELKSGKDFLYLNMGNMDYSQILSIPIPGVEEKDLHATVDAAKFLNLVSKMTSETIEMEKVENGLKIEGNGVYILPIEFLDNEMYTVSKLEVGEVFCDFSCSAKELDTIQNYNSKQLDRGYSSNPVQQLYYLDEKGCLTFTSGATICTFDFPKPFKVLLNNKTVKLFKIFSSLGDEDLNIKLGHYEIDSNKIGTRIRIESPSYVLTAACPSDDLINQIPYQIIRNRGLQNYDNEVIIQNDHLQSALDRFLIFLDKHYTDVDVHFSNVGMTLKYGKNEEELFYQKPISVELNYDLILDLNYLKSVVTSLSYKFIKLRFGDHQSISVVTENIVHVIPEIGE